VSHHRDDRSGRLIADEVLETDQVGIVGQWLARHRRLPHPRGLDQNRGGLHRSDPGAGEHQTRRQVALAEKAADVALDLAPLLGQRAVAIVGPLRGVSHSGVGVADKKKEHGDQTGLGVGKACSAKREA
jgi:hypothetical protein